MRILVTGASGLLGSHVAHHFSKKHSVIAQFYSNKIDIHGCHNIAADLTSDAELKALFKLKPDVVIHCAALANIDECERNKKLAWNLNVTLTKKITQCCEELKARLIFISTNAVFDGKHKEYYEDDEPSPINHYAQTKCLAEDFVLKYKQSTVLRFAPIGPSLTGNPGFLDWIFKQLATEKQIQGLCDVTFNPIFVRTAAENIEAIIEKKLTGIYHLGSKESITKLDLIRKIKCRAEITGHINSTTLEKLGLPGARPKHLKLATTKFLTATGTQAATVDGELWKLFDFLKTRDYAEFKSMAKPMYENIFAVVPALNEENTIEAVLTTLQSIANVIVVDDGSIDKTVMLAKAHPSQPTVIQNNDNLGYDKAIEAGFRRAIKQNATIIFTFDADNQHRAQDVEELLVPIKAHTCDIAIGHRKSKPRISEHLFAWLLQRSHINDPLCGLKIYRDYIFKTVGYFDKLGSIGSQLTIESQLRGFRLYQKPIICNQRKDTSRFGKKLVSNVKIIGAMLRVFLHYGRRLL
jgi:dTDP-4-dehydrorhamnose reductase